MEYTLLPVKHKINFKGKEYTFKSPYIYDFLEFTSILDSGDIKLYPSAIKIIVNLNIDDIEVIGYIKIIIEQIIEQIYPQGNNKGGGNGDSFFPANIDYLASSYGMHPVDFMKKTTLNQLDAITAAKEWNINIKNGEKHKNKQILTRQLGKEFENAAKDRIRLKLNSRK